MSSTVEKLAACGIAVPTILMPEKGIDHAKWAVIACDQFSSDKNYWKKVEDFVSDSPSTLNMILPECYLDESDTRVPEINRTMKTYLDTGILKEAGTGFVYMKRSTPWVASRRGLIVALDLEEYSYEKGAECQIRPTEGTVLERLPVRAAIRRNAVLDIPHILVLFDDPEDRVFKFLEEKKGEMKPLYDFDIPEKGGHLEGHMADKDEVLKGVAEIFTALNESNDFLFAVGDGNHSLGAAKQLWENIKAEGSENIMEHPARWALVELENIHDSGLNFEPIHRVLFDLDTEDFIKEMKSFRGFSLSPALGREEMKKLVEASTSERGGPFKIGVQQGETCSILSMENSSVSLPAEAFHEFLDPWLKRNSSIEIDYIHGDEVLQDLSSKNGNIGFYLPGIDKSSFFSMISSKGALPRKTFSIGEAEEKRYYLESRKIIN